MKQYDKILLKTDNYADENIRNGDEGYIIEVYPDGKFEVEFSDPQTGETIALVVLSEEEIKLITE